MGKNVIGIIGAVALGVLTGVVILGSQMKDVALKRFLSKQEQSLQLQRQLSQQVALLNEGLKKKSQSAASANWVQRQNALEQRISNLEKQIKALAQQKGAAANRPPAPPPEDFTTVHQIDAAHSPILGAKDAPVTLVEFVDFQCPFCARFHEPLAEAVKAYPGKVNYMIKNFPLSFHPQAKPAAKAAFAAGEQGKYAQMVELLLDNGRALNEDKFNALAEELGLDVAQFKKDYKDKDAQWESYIQKDMALGAKVGVRGTPTFYINGRKTSARDVNAFKKEIEKALAEKK